jgi:transcriptional regulator
MASGSLDLLKGTLDAMVLKALSWGPMHGYGVARWIEQVTGDVFAIEEGSLYPALHRMERRGWISSSWGASENNRRARFYTLTPEGRKQLRAEASAWLRFSGAVSRVFGAAAGPAALAP